MKVLTSVLAFCIFGYGNLLITDNVTFKDPPKIEIVTKQPENFIPREPESVISIEDVTGISTEDLELFAGIVNAEDGADCFDNKVAVACLVFNRMESEEHKESVRDVITEGGQFSTYSHKRDCAYNPVSGKTVYATDECKEAILYAFLYRPLPINVIYFSAYDYFSGLEPYKKIGDNYFCYG